MTGTVAIIGAGSVGTKPTEALLEHVGCRRDQHVVAGITVNVWDATDRLKALITAGGRTSPAALADQSMDLSLLTKPVLAVDPPTQANR